MLNSDNLKQNILCYMRFILPQRLTHSLKMLKMRVKMLRCRLFLKIFVFLYISCHKVLTF